MKRVKLIDSIEHYRPDLLTALRHHRQRTCVGAKALLNTLDDVPDGIDAGRIDYWLSGDAKSAPKDHVLYVLNNWENLPTLQTVHITDNLFETLTDHRNRTGVGQCALLSGRKDIPEGLTSSTIQRWLTQRSKTARKDHLDYVLGEWEKRPNHETLYVPATEQMARILRSEQDRTNVTPYALLKDKSNLPEELTVAGTRNLLAGRLRKVKKEHLEYILYQWENLPTVVMADDVEGLRNKHGYKRKSPTAKPEHRRIELTEEIRQTLKSEWERTGLAPRALLGLPAETPKGLKAGHISKWILGKVDTAREDYLDHVLTKWASRPNKRS